MRVYVIETLGKGGLIHYSFHMCRALQRVGVDTTLVTSKDYELEGYPHEFRLVKLLNLWDPRTGKDASMIRRRLRRAVRGMQYIYEWLRLVRYLRQEKPDVIMFGEMRFAFEARFLRMLRASGLKLADIVHDVQTYDVSRGSAAIVQESQAHLARYNALYNLFSALFIHSRSNYELFLDLYNVPPERVHQIEHATSELMLEVPQQYTADELKHKLGIPAGKAVVTFFGTVTKYKGVEDLIQAFPAVVKATGAQLLIAGYPTKDIDSDELRELAKELGIADSVSWFLDYVPNEWVATVMELSDVIVLPYRAITQSGVLQIAYACGKPVVVTRVGGLPDIVEAGKSGLIAEAGNPESLVSAITGVILDPEKAHQMGEYAHELSETRYSWRTVAETIKSVFEKL